MFWLAYANANATTSPGLGLLVEEEAPGGGFFFSRVSYACTEETHECRVIVQKRPKKLCEKYQLIWGGIVLALSEDNQLG